MAEEAGKLEAPSLARDLEAALAVLSAALAEANRAIAIINSNITRVGVLAETVREMEAAMALARQNLSIQIGSTPQAAISPAPSPAFPEEETADPSGPEATSAQPVATLLEPERESAESPASPAEPEIATGGSPSSLPGQEDPSPSPQVASIRPATAAPERETIRPISHRMRMTVGSKVGSLDLKAVDGAVNENPAVVDVALLDYDGRHATLKLWVSGTADPRGVQESLLASLRRRLGDDQDAEVDIDFEEAAAA